MDVTPKTKRICVASVGLIGVCTILGMAFGAITFSEASTVVMPIVTGLFALVNS